MALGTKSGKGRDPVVTQVNRPTMGEEIYSHRPDAPSASEFRAGYLAARPSVSSADMVEGVGQRPATLAEMLGPRFAPAVNFASAPGYEENASTQANGRIVPPALGQSRNYWAGAAE